MKNIEALHRIDEAHEAIEKVLADAWDRSHHGREQLLTDKERVHLDDMHMMLHDIYYRMLGSWKQEEEHDE